MNLKLLRENLKSTRRDLAKVHKSLLDFQLRIQESLDERRYGAGDLLQLSIQSPDFEWLKPLGKLIVHIDDFVDEELAEEVFEMRDEITKALTAFFIDETKHASFKKRLESAMSKDPNLCLEVASLREDLARL